MPDTDVAGFALDEAWMLHPRVAVRPERFGALLYSFDTRRLSFLKQPKLRAVVESLDTCATARAACAGAGVSDTELPSYAAALATLADTAMICRRDVRPASQ